MSKTITWSFALLLLCGTAWSAEGDATTDKDQAGPDFQVQGEYRGKLQLSGKETAVGVQVVALGDHKFDAVLFTGGLPGDGWKRGDKQEKVEGVTEGDKTTFKGPNWTATISGGKFGVQDSGGTSLGSLEKTERTSPTLGAKPPEGAVVLFDGTNVDHWQGGQMTPDKLLMVGTTGKDEFQDFTLHLEFRTPFMPKARGQGRGNSGMYLQNRYEVQVLDSFGLEGANNECGGLYSVQAPKVNMCLPPLAWQTYDVEFKGARFDGEKKLSNAHMTIKHNGVGIYEDFDMPGITPGGAGKEAPGKGPLQLQNHGNPVNFRNIWVVPSKT